ncbi:hypothetical protein [Dactylosporangium sp. NPDC000521]|uniref:hypothetical protein n=1 Tax=Dactylosporangium sp. NPDC000521 TaxID=3363975 RepID=UPI0036831965
MRLFPRWRFDIDAAARDLAGYVTAQVAGAVLADLMVRLPAIDFADKDRTGGDLWLGAVGVGLLLALYPSVGSAAGDVVVPHGVPQQEGDTG